MSSVNQRELRLLELLWFWQERDARLLNIKISSHCIRRLASLHAIRTSSLRSQ
jgi:ribosomal protein L28